MGLVDGRTRHFAVRGIGRAAYNAITRPLLVIGFTDDRMIPAYLCREVADAVPGAQYVEIPDAGHSGYLEQPEKVNQLILDFLADRS